MSKNSAFLSQVKRSIGDHLIYTLTLSFTHLKIASKQFFEFTKVAKRYYKNFKFLQIDFYFYCLYAFKNPYRISKQFLLEMGSEDIYSYGESYISTLHRITKECGVLSSDHFYELGCGRGKALFWVSCFVKCCVTGIEMIPEFITKARWIIKTCKLQNIELIEKNFLEVDFTPATVIYFYGTSFTDSCIQSLIAKFTHLKAGTKIITVSFPLSDYTPLPLFKIVKQFQAHYPWGIADVYLQIKL